MKALITIIDDDGKVIMANKLIPHTGERDNGISHIYEFRFEYGEAKEEREREYKWQLK